jgi:hypothetical protein
MNLADPSHSLVTATAGIAKLSFAGQTQGGIGRPTTDVGPSVDHGC